MICTSRLGSGLPCSASQFSALRCSALLSSLIGAFGCGLDASVSEPASACGSCRDTEAARLDDLYVELTPQDSRYAKTQVGGLSLGPDRPSPNLTLSLATQYNVIVQDSTGVPLDAELDFFGEERIAGRELDAHALINRMGGRVSLLAGPYSVRIHPVSRPSLPSIDTGFTVRPSREVLLKEFRFPPAFKILRGTVRSSVAIATRMPNVVVQACSTQTGLASTVSVTDETGHYEVMLPVSTDREYRLTAKPMPEAQPAWSFEDKVILTDLISTKELEIEPTSESLRGTARIQLVGYDATTGSNAIASARATLSAGRPGVPSVFYRVEAESDLSGFLVQRDQGRDVDVPLLGAIYEVLVEPAAGSPFARTSTTLDLRAVSPTSKPDVQIILPPRPHVDGRIVSSLGRPVPNAQLQFHRIGVAAGEEVGTGLRPEEVITRSDGSFSVFLDAGPHLMIARSNRTRDGDELLPVGIKQYDISNDARVSLPPYTLPRGALLRGLVRGDADGAPVSMTRVELFVRVFEETISLGHDRTDPEGAFELTVPERSDPE